MSEVAAAPEVSAGTLLRQAREAAGLHVAALAVSLKVPVRKLEALEADRYDDLPDAVFARALASSICRNLKIDPQPVLARLPQTASPRLVQDHEGINAPFRAPGDVAAGGWQQQLMRPVPLAVGALLLGAVAILLLPYLSLDAVRAVARPEAPAVPMAASVVVQPGAAAPADAPAATGAAVPAPDPAPAPAADASAASGAPVAAATATAPAAATEPAATLIPAAGPPAAAASSATPSSTAAPTAPAAPPSGGVVVFKTSGPSWVQVLDSRGEVALRRLMAAGESASASGTTPLSVTVGSVNSTSVEVRGKPFDMAPVEKDNVARFEVK
ncbi:helix-turn-helix domain-containing protein [Ramlibacter sp.]|uniref:helix-turn-helix domain-containing protein n=1 Tax=Ramlibacter sp. TaxID=1917967 RepID=UPI002D253058|nr:RodZ domain-containing protein [Ramlibacter sp.]HYD74465.1 RodZ domain-containing protein [Ramlibacter sp.]